MGFGYIVCEFLVNRLLWKVILVVGICLVGVVVVEGLN